MTTVIELLRDTAARGAVLRQLAAAFDLHATWAQVALGEGQEDEAKQHDRIADHLLRAWKAEGRHEHPDWDTER